MTSTPKTAVPEGEILDPTCATCVYRRDLPEEQGGLVCRIKHTQATGEVDSTVSALDHCGDGGWEPRDLGLEQEAPGLVNFVTARINVRHQRELKSDSGLVVPSRRVATLQ